MKRPKRLTCHCCGESTRGRQWWNRDTGYGTCTSCADRIEKKEGAEYLESIAGIRGIHFDIKE